MIFDKLAIVSDLDGTLFNREQRIPEKSLKAIEYFKSLGGTFTFATGRDLNFILRRFPFLVDLVNAPVILSNGAHLYDFAMEKTYVDITLNKDSITELLARVYNRFPDVPFEIACHNKYVIVNPNAHFFKRYDKMRDLAVFTDELIIPDDDIIRVNFIDRDQTRLNGVSELVKNFGFYEKFECVFSETFIFEVLSKNATKGNGVDELRNIFCNNLRIIAVGDYYNDMSQLQRADLALCPSNAAPGIKDFCEYVLCDCDNGVIADVVNGLENNIFDF